MNSYLPNMRLICLPSENLGKDWFEKSAELDEFLTQRGIDLAEEAVYLLYSDIPQEINSGNGQCLVARSVIGPKIEVKAPMALIDWTATPVWREVVQGENSEQHILKEAQKCYEVAQKGPRPLVPSFMLRVRRHLGPELNVQREVLFHE